MATIWCACAETFNGEQEFRTHQWGLSRDKHHRSRAVAEQAPSCPAGHCAPSATRPTCST